MNKKYLLIGGVAALLVLAVFVVLWNVNPSQQGRDPAGHEAGQKLPDYVLSQGEEKQVRSFVQNFVSLYNTYSNDDFSNLLALGDYQTPAMQEATARLVSEKTGSLPQGFAVRSEAKGETFAYSYPSALKLEATVEMTVRESGPGAGAPYTATAKLDMKKNGSLWLADSLVIIKK